MKARGIQKRAEPARVLPSLSARVGLLQRKCACGGTPGPTGECENCQKKRKGFLQRHTAGTSIAAPWPRRAESLLIGQPNSSWEREADQAASAVTNGKPIGRISSASEPRTLQRQAGIIPGGPLKIGIPKGALNRKLPERKQGGPHGTYPIDNPAANPCLKEARCKLFISGSNIDLIQHSNEKEAAKRETLKKEGARVTPSPAPQMTAFLRSQAPGANRLSAKCWWIPRSFLRLGPVPGAVRVLMTRRLPA